MKSSTYLHIPKASFTARAYSTGLNISSKATVAVQKLFAILVGKITQQAATLL